MVNIFNLIGLKTADQDSKGSIRDVFTRLFPQRTKGKSVPEWQRIPVREPGEKGRGKEKSPQH